MNFKQNTGGVTGGVISFCDGTICVIQYPNIVYITFKHNHTLFMLWLVLEHNMRQTYLIFFRDLR